MEYERRVRERLSELEHERLLKIKELERLEAEQLETVPGAIELLDELPIGEDLLASGPRRPPPATQTGTLDSFSRFVSSLALR